MPTLPRSRPRGDPHARTRRARRPRRRRAPPENAACSVQQFVRNDQRVARERLAFVHAAVVEEQLRELGKHSRAPPGHACLGGKLRALLDQLESASLAACVPSDGAERADCLRATPDVAVAPPIAKRLSTGRARKRRAARSRASWERTKRDRGRRSDAARRRATSDVVQRRSGGFVTVWLAFADIHPRYSRSHPTLSHGPGCCHFRCHPSLRP